MNVLIDTNVILDIILRREPFFKNAARVSVLSEKGCIRGYMSASAVTDVFYVAKRQIKSTDVILNLLEDLFRVISVASVTENIIFEALELKWDDFEDSVQYRAGQSISAEYIITRNPKDFAESKIKVISPEDFLRDITLN